jgi:TIR domain-containing protein
VPFQIFVSYARKDDLSPLGPGSKGGGFVKVLRRYLEHFFADLGPTEPVLWRDVGEIEDGDQFEPLIREGIEASSMLLVVLSNNWLSRPFCQDELTMFAERWKDEGEDGIRRRIVCVFRRPLDFSLRPPLLQGANGYSFFRDDKEDGVTEFFSLGKANRDYVKQAEALAKYLHRRAQANPVPVDDPSTRRKELDAPAPYFNGRTIYLAKYASDVVAPYERLVDELQRRGYRVVPDPREKLPEDESCVEVIDEALRSAELSIHLLGDSFGASPENCPPIAKLQLARAAEQVSAVRDGPAFRRIIWAPKVFTPKNKPAEIRDPFDVLARFGDPLDTDTIDGKELSKFVDFIADHLANRGAGQPPPPVDAVNALAGKQIIYLYFQKNDKRYALSLASSFNARGDTVLFPSFQDDPQAVDSWHHQKLEECDAVVVCWADAGEVWVKQQTPQWKNWETLGRHQGFTFRGVVFGPPSDENDSKHFYHDAFKLKLLARDEVDVVLDLSQYAGPPPPEALDPLFGVAASS